MIHSTSSLKFRGLVSAAFVIAGLFAADSLRGAWAWRVTGPACSAAAFGAVGPEDGRTSFLLTHYFLLRSDNGWKSWYPLEVPPADFEYVGLVAHADDPSVVLIASRLYGVWQSLDGGREWTNVYSDNMAWIGGDPTNPDRFFGWGGYNDKMFIRSDDRGSTWTNVAPQVSRFHEAAVHPVSGMLLALGYDQDGSAAWRSSDAGDSWERMAIEDGPVGVRDLEADPGATATFYAVGSRELFRSSDGGGLWAEVPIDVDGRLESVFVDRDSRVYLAGEGGVYRSETGFGPFERLSLDREVLRVMDDPRPGGPLVALAKDTAHTSWDDGASWERVSLGASTASIGELFVPPGSPHRVVGAAYRCFGPILGSSDGGVTWPEAGPSSQSGSRARLRASSVDPKRMWTDGFTSRDGGRSWTAAEWRADALAFDQSNPNRMIRTEAYAFEESLDGGETWETLLEQTYPRRLVQDLVPNPGRPGELFGFHEWEDWLLRSRDGGASWVEFELRYGSSRDLEFDPLEPNRLYLVNNGSAALRSEDGGESWVELDEPGFITDLAVGPDGWLVAATTAGLMASDDQGETWTELAPDALVTFTELAVVSRDLIYAASGHHPDLFDRPGRGVYVLETIPDWPGGSWRGDPRLPGFEMKFRITTSSGEQPSVRVDESCIPETVCVSGAVPGRSELFLRMVGPKPNGFLWPTASKFSTSRVEVWVRQLSTGTVRYYDLAGAAPDEDVLAGLFHRTGFLPDLATWEASVAAASAGVASRAEGEWFTDDDFPDFRFAATITNQQGQQIEVGQEADCIDETVCLSGAVPGRSELFVRVVGPKPNGYLWPTLVRFTTSRVDVWIEQLSTGVERHYVLPAAEPESTAIDGLFDREGFEP